MNIDTKRKIDDFLSDNDFFVEFENGDKTYALIKEITSCIQEELCNAYKIRESNSVLMIDTQLTSKQRKNESVLVLDIGGTNVRKCIVKFDNDGNPTMGEIVKSPIKPMMESDNFFKEFAEFIANRKGFTRRELSEVKSISLCFSYPFRAETNGDAQLCGFAKGINIDQFKGKLLIKSIVESLNEIGVNLPYKGFVVNDATAALFYLSLLTTKDNSIKIGAIVGTGCNAGIYIKDNNNTLKAICTESGHLTLEKNNSNLLTRFDRCLDKIMGTNGGSNFEMITSGFYLFRELRVIIENILNSNILNEINDIDELTNTQKVIKDTKDFDCYLKVDEKCITSYLITLIIKRASVYLSGLLLGLANLTDDFLKKDSKSVDVFIEGSTYHLTKFYKDYTENLLNKFSKRIGGYTFSFYYPTENDGKTILLGTSIASSVS